MISAADPSDLPDVLELLRSSSLPEAGVAGNIESFLVARDEAGRLVGTIGLEVYGEVGLLRSLAVRSDRRSAGVGTELVERLMVLAREKKIGTVYLLTTTAESYFPRFGFARVPREQVDSRLAASEELRGACPSSAILMRAPLSEPGGVES
jgi:amino-acid N-acetyltransferase